MDFAKVLEFLIADFERERLDYALIGGFAMGALGIVRATMDLDFLVKKDQLGPLREIMRSRGYRMVHSSEDVSQFVSDLKLFGAVDFLHAYRPLSLQMLGRSTRRPIFNGKYQIPVLQPEDIIGLKVQSLANNPDRLEMDSADIILLLKRFSGNLDWNRMEGYFALFGKDLMFKDLKERYGPEGT